jgi:hypothetical protein
VPSAAVRARGSRRAITSSLPREQAPIASSTDRARAIALVVAGGYPGHVGGPGEGDLVGFSGERSAVHDGQRVALAGVVKQERYPVSRALGFESRAGGEHPQSVACGRDELSGGQPGGDVLGGSHSDRGELTPA